MLMRHPVEKHDTPSRKDNIWKNISYKNEQILSEHYISTQYENMTHTCGGIWSYKCKT